MADRTYPKELYQTGIYRSWASMKARCNRKTSHDYKNYGARGIKVSPKWESFAGFYEDMKDEYANGLSIERINNDGDYFKGNCKWATKKEQARNRRTTHLFEFNGKKQILTQWAEDLKIARSTLAQRFYVYGWPIEKVLTN